MEILNAKQVEQLLSRHPLWCAADCGKAVAAEFEFESFAEAWGFMCAIAMQAEQKDHHPEWSNINNRVHIRLTTHNTDSGGGLTNLDAGLLKRIDAIWSRRKAVGPTSAP